MTVERIWAAVLAAAIAIIAITAWSQHSVIGMGRVFAKPVPHTTTIIDSVVPVLPSRAQDLSEPRFDLNGNEVDDAVSDYRVDGRGELYERHAPDTALLQLSAPEL